jgi:O-antigen ligase
MMIHIDNGNRKNLIAYSIVLMLICLFVSRAFLSASMMVFLVLSLVHKNIGLQLRSFIQNNYLVSISILFFLPFITIFWSADKQEWVDIIRIKAPLVFFPLAFAGTWQLSAKQWKNISYIFLLLLAIAVSWSLAKYFSDITALNEAYLRSKTIITPLEDDHVRFSWLCAFAVMLCLLLIQKQQGYKALLWLLAFFFTVYLHILSARMGLFSLYLFLILYAGWLLVKRKDRKLSIALLAAIILLPAISWFIFPTFRNRIQYFLYDISLVKNASYVSGSNDGARIQSLKAGWEVVKENPLGVGAGDLKQAVFHWYDLHVPAMSAGEKFLPCSEWLIYGGFAGWPGILVLIFVMAIPFIFRKIQNRVYWIGLNAMVAFSFGMDMTIEAQFGVFIYVFIVLWWWKWFQIKLPDEQ